MTISFKKMNTSRTKPMDAGFHLLSKTVLKDRLREDLFFLSLKGFDDDVSTTRVEVAVVVE